ncbi:MAG TPA: hexose kinase [Vicinamibacteria bacterium]|nr:hexose kinase [Vicinamibacteria bacterium]
MITVGGFNTSLDKAMVADDLTLGAVNRVRDVRATPGGKGVHVALAVATLGEPVSLVGLVDAARRREFTEALGSGGVHFDGVESPGGVRTCLAIRDRAGRVTEILEPGPDTDPPTREALCARFLSRAARSPVAVLSGSAPLGFGHAVYAELVAALRASPVRVLVDASGALLEQGALARPFLIKPNRDEAEVLAGAAIEGPAAATRVARALLSRGPGTVILSLGDAGAVAVTEGRAAHARVAVEAVNAVGSGDCLLGGVAVGLARGLSFDDVLRLGVACGAANAMSGESGRFERADVETLLPRVELTVL